MGGTRSGRKVSLIQPEVIFGLHMSDKKSVENLTSLLVSYLIANPGSSAKKAAKALDVGKKQVNAILYGQEVRVRTNGGFATAVVGSDSEANCRFGNSRPTLRVEFRDTGVPATCEVIECCHEKRSRK